MSPFAARAAAWLFVVLVLAALVVGTSPAAAFCGFYVGKADAGLFNEASKVILVRRDGKTVISMANDYRGALTEFALVVPVPQVLERDQIHIGERTLFERIDAYSAPRLAEYYDPDPCVVKAARALGAVNAPLPASALAKEESRRDKALGVTVEAAYTVGEYDIVMLSAKQSDGLETWLRDNGYRIPKGASAALKPVRPPEHEILRREGEPQGAGKDGRRLSAAAAIRVRVCEVHAAGAPRHAERQRPAGSRALRADAAGTRRDDELPDREAAVEHGSADLRPQRIRDRRTRRCSMPRRRARITARSSPSTSGTWAGAIRAPRIR